MPTRPLAITVWAASLLAVLALAQASPQDPTANAAGIELYEKKIRPLFAEQCYGCHGTAQQLSGLRLDLSTSVRKGGNRGSLLAGGIVSLTVGILTWH